MKTFNALLIFIAAVLIPHLANAGSANLSVSATIASKSICNFRTASATLDFGTLDPLTHVDATATASVIFRCFGSAPTIVYLVSEDSGSYDTGPGGNRMRHTTNPVAYLPYSLTLSPATGSFPRVVAPQDHTLTITGLVRGVDYQNASNGSYSDTVVLTINP